MVDSSFFRLLRVYHNLTVSQLLNSMLCNRLMKTPFMVLNSRFLYNSISKVIGSTPTHFLLKNTFGKALTAGSTLHEASKTADYFRSQSTPVLIQDIPVILDYCAEG